MRSDIRDALHNFWKWLRKRGVVKLHEVPEFPSIPFTLKMGKIVDKETQFAILDKIKEMSYDIDPKIWVGITLHANNPSIRPIELREAREQDFDLNRDVLLLHKTKEGHSKVAPLCEADVEMVRQVKEQFPGFGEQYFLRHSKGFNRVKEGDRYGQHYLAKWWDRACKELGIEGVPLYRGTKHSSATALCDAGYSREDVKQVTGHSTNEAFDRYIGGTESRVRAMVAKAAKRNTVQFQEQGEGK